MEVSSESREVTASKWNFYNVIMLGFAFMFVFTAFQTSSMIEVSIFDVLCIIRGDESFSIGKC